MLSCLPFSLCLFNSLSLPLSHFIYFSIYLLYLYISTLSLYPYLHIVSIYNIFFHLSNYRLFVLTALECTMLLQTFSRFTIKIWPRLLLILFCFTIKTECKSSRYVSNSGCFKLADAREEDCLVRCARVIHAIAQSRVGIYIVYII